MPVNNYEESAIKVLKGLEAVRERPGMYIGDTSFYGLHHLVFELVDNSVDEALAGFCKNIEVIIHKDNSVTVLDDGRGIPTGIHPEEKISTLELVLTRLHAGGKFTKKAYKFSGGLHGVGLSVVNALSEWLTVEVYREGKIFRQDYRRGKPITPVKIIGKTNKTGTKITFKPDKEIFEKVEFSWDYLAARLRELAFLNPGLTLKLKDEREEPPREAVFYYKDGIKEFVDKLAKNKGALFSEPVYLKGEKKIEEKNDEIQVEVAFSYTNSYQEIIYSFVNNINTREGGTHVTGFKLALTKALQKFIKDNNIKVKGVTLTGEDLREGLVAVVSVKLMHPQFEGQTKTRLGNSYVKDEVYSIVYNYLIEYFQKHPQIAKKIIDKAILAAKARIAAKKAKELTRRKSALEDLSLPGKLADCSERDPKKTELFIVEGESAAGSSKQARNRRLQAILPIRGKIINVEKASLDKVLKNEEIKSIISALGTGFGKDFDITKLRYNKIIIMTDSDIDGSHIRTLLLTFFFRFFPGLIENGHVYIALPPLYKLKKGKWETYVLSDKELNTYICEFASKELSLIDKNGKALSEKDTFKLLTEIGNYLEYVKVIAKYKFLDLALKLLELDVDYTELLEKDTAKKLAEKLLENIKDKEKYSYKIVLDENLGSYKIKFTFKENPFIIYTYTLDEILLKSDIYNKTKEFLKDIKDVLGNSPYKLKYQEKIKEFEDLEKLYNFALEVGRKGTYIQRYKGLGEMNPDQLWETTMNPKTRNLKLVTLEDAVEADEIFNILMGDKVEPRREFIKQYAKKVKNLDI